jgi:ATP-binding cassette subfamily F protein uup
MDHIVDHLLVFEGNGKIRDYHSNYTVYRMQKAAQQRESLQQQRQEKPKYERSKSEKRKATYKEQKEYEVLTAEIEALTTEKADLERKLSDGSLTSPADITKASTRIGELMPLLDEKELRWLELEEIING